MADDEKKQDDAKVEKDGKPEQNAAKIGILTWVILGAIVTLCAGSGLLLGRLFAGADESETQSLQTDQPSTPQVPITDDSASDGDGWYYPLESVVVSLDEPGVGRYVRVSIMLEISSAMDQGKGKKIIEEKKPVLTNWLTVYLSNLTLDDTRGDRNLKRIQLQILDAFNEKLFPDAKPLIKKILFKEFVVQ